MKPILSTLSELKALIDKFAATTDHQDVLISLIGGYAVIAHGVEGTTKDIDTLVIGKPYEHFGRNLSNFLKKELRNKNIEVMYRPQSADSDDPLQHEIIIIKDKSNKTAKIDILIARYKWEMEGLMASRKERNIPISILPKPYLIAMKLKAGGLKDDYSVSEMYTLLTEGERKKTIELAKLIHKDRKLAELSKPKISKPEKEDISLLINNVKSKRPIR